MEGRNSNHLQKLMAMGVLTNIPVKVIRKYSSIIFDAGFSQFTVDGK